MALLEIRSALPTWAGGSGCRERQRMLWKRIQMFSLRDCSSQGPRVWWPYFIGRSCVSLGAIKLRTCSGAPNSLIPVSVRQCETWAWTLVESEFRHTDSEDFSQKKVLKIQHFEWLILWQNEQKQLLATLASHQQFILRLHSLLYFSSNFLLVSWEKQLKIAQMSGPHYQMRDLEEVPGTWL